MIYRTLAVLVVLFWITMSALLLHKELVPKDSALREVPVSHVVKLMIHHEQPSDLTVYYKRQRIGHVRIYPKIRKDDGQRVLETTGNLPGIERQRVAWTGNLVMDKLLNVVSGKLTIGLRDPTPITLDILFDPPQNRLSYETHNGPQLMAKGTYTLDETGVSSWMQEQGIDPTLLRTLHRPNTPTPSISAHQSSMLIRNERVDTYLIKIVQNEQTILELHISQLGQILSAEARMFEVSAAPEDITF